MTTPAIAKRLFGFCAGPENHEFYACGQHRHDLEDGDPPSTVFFALKGHQAEDVDPDDGYTCDYCREG